MCSLFLFVILASFPLRLTFSASLAGGVFSPQLSWVVLFWWMAYRTQLGDADQALQRRRALASQQADLDAQASGSKRPAGAGAGGAPVLLSPALIFQQRGGMPDQVLCTDPRLVSFVKLQGGHLQGEQSLDDSDEVSI